VPADAEPERLFAAIAAEHERTVGSVLEVVEAKRLLDRHPLVQRSIALRNPYVDPMNAIQVDLLRRYRAADETGRGRIRRPLLRSIAGIAQRSGTRAERNKAGIVSGESFTNP
jgi:phosphoenolpyruvate carboxylase